MDKLGEQPLSSFVELKVADIIRLDSRSTFA